MQERLVILLQLFAQGKASPEETEQLMEIIRLGEYDEVIETFMAQSWSGEETAFHLTEAQTEELYGKIINDRKLVSLKSGSKVIYKWVAAASIIIIATIMVVLALSKNSLPKNDGNGTQPVTQAPSRDVTPGSFKAKLTLADGSVITIDSALKGQLTKQGNTAIINKDGTVIYQSTDSLLSTAQATSGYNTLSTAKGESYSVTLGDGTKVWLNAASSIKYPVTFTGNERKVEISGEAYFEVKHHAQKPFKVLVNGVEVEDLGTEFNINAYEDEPAVSTTLVSGSVIVKRQTAKVKLKPGEQAVSSFETDLPSLKINHSVDIEKIIAWRNNEFDFKDDNIETIMRQLARWYNIEVAIRTPSQTQYTGRISRNVPLSKVLDMFERVGYVKFEIEGKTVSVIPVQ